MKNLYNLSFLSFVLFILTTGCDKEKEEIPAYLHIAKFTLSTNNLTEGLNTQDISDAKIFVNSKEIGSFELPVTIPVLSKGNVTVSIFPNIKENGSSSKRVNYKPFKIFEQNITLEALKVDTIKPTTSYRANCNFLWIEDFDDNANSLQRLANRNNTSDSLVIIPTSTLGVEQPFSGSNFCGFINIAASSNDVFFDRNTLNQFTVPNLGADVFLEIDVKSNTYLQVGFISDDGTTVEEHNVLEIFETDGKWKKIYVNLKPETSELKVNTKISIFFSVYKPASDITLSPKVYLDNLKLLYLN